MSGLGTNYVFSFNNWLFGGPGQGVQILQIDGLEDVPNLRTQDDNRGYADGMFTGRDFLDGRYITMVLQIMTGSDGTPMSTYLNELKANLVSQQTGTSPLIYTIPGEGTRLINARVRKRAISIDPNYSYGFAKASVQFFCPDPRLYSNTLVSNTLSPLSTRFRTYARTYPMTYTPSGTSGTNSATVTNNGNYTTFPTITVSGSCVGPVVAGTVNGVRYSLAFPTLALGSTDQLVINNDLRTVTLNGSPVRNLLQNGSQWFGFPPGVPATVDYAVTSGSGTCTFTYRDAYI